jgi:hypothetical protein
MLARNISAHMGTVGAKKVVLLSKFVGAVTVFSLKFDMIPYYFLVVTMFS